ncbi:MAG TPA: hypothetical protein VKY45_11540 [Marinilabiliaceae bacterium]|nr:hypothetical protein [Marinilabiliaceae bacterium]
MANIDVHVVLDKLKEEVINIALSTVKNYKTEAKRDALNLLEEMKGNLKTWTLQLAEGKLSKEDFEYLVLGQKEVIEMNALKQAGLSLVKADEFKNKLLNLVIKTVVGLI